MKNEFERRNEEFERRLKTVEKLMESDEFKESVNRNLIIEDYSDGQRPYSIDDVQALLRFEREALLDGSLDTDDPFSQSVGLSLKEATDNFSKPGSITATGNTVYALVDMLLYESLRQGILPHNIAQIIELPLDRVIFAFCGVSYSLYQVDISISGQGLLEDTYTLDIQFRPVPKNIEFK